MQSVEMCYNPAERTWISWKRTTKLYVELPKRMRQLLNVTWATMHTEGKGVIQYLRCIGSVGCAGQWFSVGILICHHSTVRYLKGYGIEIKPLMVSSACFRLWWALPSPQDIQWNLEWFLVKKKVTANPYGDFVEHFYCWSENMSVQYHG